MAHSKVIMATTKDGFENAIDKFLADNPTATINYSNFQYTSTDWGTEVFVMIFIYT